MTITSNRIKSSRLKKGMTMENLAEKMSAGKSTIASWENGSREPKRETLKKLAKVLGVSYLYLEGFIDTENEELETFESGSDFEKRKNEILDNHKKENYKKTALMLAVELSDINKEKWLEYGNLLLNSQNNKE